MNLNTINSYVIAFDLQVLSSQYTQSISTTPVYCGGVEELFKSFSHASRKSITVVVQLLLW